MAGNRWARVDVGYFQNPKIASVSAPAAMLHLASILHCADQLTDGAVSDRALIVCTVGTKANPRRAPERAAELVDAGLWIPNGDGWYLHDFPTMNPQAMRAAVEHERERWRKRQARARAGDVTP